MNNYDLCEETLLKAFQDIKKITPKISLNTNNSLYISISREEDVEMTEKSLEEALNRTLNSLWIELAQKAVDRWYIKYLLENRAAGKY